MRKFVMGKREADNGKMKTLKKRGIIEQNRE